MNIHKRRAVFVVMYLAGFLGFVLLGKSMLWIVRADWIAPWKACAIFGFACLPYSVAVCALWEWIEDKLEEM